MRDPGDHTAQQTSEMLQVGLSRPPASRVPTWWPRPGVTVLAFALGLLIGTGAVLGWQARPRPAPAPFHVDEHAVELMLFAVVPPLTQPDGRESVDTPLRVDGAVFLSGAVTATVLGVDSLDRSLDVRASALPVTVAPTARLQSVSLEIVVRDCGAASRWTPVDRPFTIKWRDEHGKRHLDRAGDFDESIARSLIEYVDAACAEPAVTRSGGRHSPVGNCATRTATLSMRCSGLPNRSDQ